MKYIIIIPDGMADQEIESLEGKTPLEYAHTPAYGQPGCCRRDRHGQDYSTGIAPGSDIANLSVMGYDPAKYHTGRSPLEAVSLGLSLRDDDMVFRCNLVTLSSETAYREKTMIDYSAGEISSEDSKVLIDYIKADLETPDISFYPGVSYRNIMVWNGGPGNMKLIPPHDILEKKIMPYLPAGEGSGIILGLMEESAT